jgi:hypothetical protein
LRWMGMSAMNTVRVELSGSPSRRWKRVVTTEVHGWQEPARTTGSKRTRPLARVRPAVSSRGAA